MPDLSATEAAVYDRQLRVWGVETQKRWASAGLKTAAWSQSKTQSNLAGCRLNAAKIVIVGCTGLAAEVSLLSQRAWAQAAHKLTGRCWHRWPRT